MLRQLLVTLVVLVVAVAGYVYFVPGSHETLQKLGLSIPGVTDGGNTQQQSGPAGAPGRGGGRGGFGGGARVITVNTQPVASSTINDKLTAMGDGAAIRSVTVAALAGGTLEELAVKPGDTVKAGDVIGHLDAQAEQIAFDKADLAEKDADAALKRATELSKSNSVAATQVAAAQLAYDNATLELRNAKLDLTRRSITTPIDGTVGLMQVTPGNYVGTQSAVTTVEDTSSILVSFWVPERYAGAITAGMPVTANATALPGQSFAGTVTAIDNRIDPASRTLAVQAELPNDKGLIKAGMSFSVILSFPGETFASVDPLAVQWSSQGAYVWKYGDGEVKKAMVSIVQRNSDGVLVSGDDVHEGDTVVTEGVLQLDDGAKVTVLQGPGAEQRQAKAELPAKPAAAQ